MKRRSLSITVLPLCMFPSSSWAPLFQVLYKSPPLSLRYFSPFESGHCEVSSLLCSLPSICLSDQSLLFFAFQFPHHPAFLLFFTCFLLSSPSFPCMTITCFDSAHFSSSNLLFLLIPMIDDPSPVSPFLSLFFVSFFFSTLPSSVCLSPAAFFLSSLNSTKLQISLCSADLPASTQNLFSPSAVHHIMILYSSNVAGGTESGPSESLSVLTLPPHHILPLELKQLPWGLESVPVASTHGTLVNINTSLEPLFQKLGHKLMGTVVVEHYQNNGHYNVMYLLTWHYRGTHRVTISVHLLPQHFQVY